jgi:lipopolysaccharide export LptBFGC system permease protein LptF
MTASGKLRGWRGTLVMSVVMITSYYFLMRFGDALVEGGWLVPTVAAWIPNVLILLVVATRWVKLQRRIA